jgi:hypothetical protein
MAADSRQRSEFTLWAVASEISYQQRIDCAVSNQISGQYLVVLHFLSNHWDREPRQKYCILFAFLIQHKIFFFIL